MDSEQRGGHDRASEDTHERGLSDVPQKVAEGGVNVFEIKGCV